MKKVILLCFIPFVLSLFAICLFAFNTGFNDLFFHSKPEPVLIESPYFNNFSDNPQFEKIFLAPDRSSNTIYLLGSSELTESNKAISYNFINSRFKTKVQGFGHAGNQCFSIFAQLLANESRLKNSKIVFIISPGWFESKPSKGTTSTIFLEYNLEQFLKNILNDSNDPEFQAYAEKRVSQLYNEFNSPNIPLKLMNFGSRATKSIIHEIIYAPLIVCDETLLKQKELLVKENSTLNIKDLNKTVITDSSKINWDSLFRESKNEVLKHSTNNNIGIENNYYSEYIKTKRGKIEPVKESLNQEMEDFKMLVKLVKEKNVNASFIISPLNPLYFKNLKALQPTIDIIENEIRSNGFPYLNLMQTDTSKYEKAILHDVMHMSDYGWYKVDKFIIDTYHLKN